MVFLCLFKCMPRSPWCFSFTSSFFYSQQLNDENIEHNGKPSPPKKAQKKRLVKFSKQSDEFEYCVSHNGAFSARRRTNSPPASLATSKSSSSSASNSNSSTMARTVVNRPLLPLALLHLPLWLLLSESKPLCNPLCRRLQQSIPWQRRPLLPFLRMTMVSQHLLYSIVSLIFTHCCCHCYVITMYKQRMTLTVLALKWKIWMVCIEICFKYYSTVTPLLQNSIMVTLF